LAYYSAPAGQGQCGGTAIYNGFGRKLVRMAERSLDILPAALIAEKERFRRSLLRWYDQNRRNLPWRQDREPYHVWISEIMLQQTRVNAVLGHYRKFLERFPTVHDLAKARESSILAAWSGLGYYRRARMMHSAARTIVKKHGGKFPASPEELRWLDGIGRYTAAAIASIAFSEATAVVDGNVERVLTRLLGRNLAGEERWQMANALLSPQRPGDFNQAMMELGATICLPRQPKCDGCPVFDFCASHGKIENAERRKRQRKREICYAFHQRNGSVFLTQRPKSASRMPGMWELPEVPSQNGALKPWLTLRHSITMTDFVVLVVQSKSPEKMTGRWVRIARITGLPLTGLARKILRTARVI